MAELGGAASFVPPDLEPSQTRSSKTVGFLVGFVAHEDSYGNNLVQAGPSTTPRFSFLFKAA